MRSLGVIFLADVVGYSKMMTDDEPGTLSLIREFQKEIGNNHAKYFDKNGWLYFTKETFDLYPEQQNIVHIKKNGNKKSFISRFNNSILSTEI